ncbi:P-loop containing nucleoside triphosphate hydrolase protein [Halteromyces radiatus]|uniref:P-loop containing nucleoside triphosphate hydrolase protein n=1 Tax=Halteromyces radiatus TaxID=101107 RepID=UPI002221120D|nr:P-loop containing nucleoside triphosphate hydrolase protein [Halteromyces radiatus]KAI8086007.1 P-loop containing nucleoside triphosphate hydrolase protein [Halteromyces radiatus]
MTTPALITAEKVIVQVSPLECTISKENHLRKGLPDYEAYIRRRLPDHTISQGQVIQWELGGRWINVTIRDIMIDTSQIIPTGQDQHYRLERKTTIIEIERSSPLSSDLTMNMQDETLESLLDMILSGFDYATSFRQLGIPVAKSILLHGVSGVGKWTMIKHASHRLECNLFEVSIQQLLELKDERDLDAFKNYNPLHLMVNKAIAGTPSILAIRDLDMIGKGNDKLIDILINEINRIPDTEKVCMIGLARQLQKLPLSLQKVDVFKQHLTISIPTMARRKQLLKTMLLDMNLDTNQESSDVIDYYSTQISLRTSGYVARDLKMICRQAGLKSRRRQHDTEMEEDIIKGLTNLNLDGKKQQRLVNWSDFEYALENHRPSQQVEVESTIIKRSWDDIGGYGKIKQRIRQTTLIPLLQPDLFKRLGISPPSGVLLYGPSGCGKTLMVQALASESMMNVISINGPEIFSKYLGDTENKIRRLFATAKRIAPCLMFIDEMDAIATRRGWDSGGDSSGGVNERVLSTLLNEMDGVEGRQGVIVIGCTNRPQEIDDAILRPGRLDQLLYVTMPTVDDRKDIITTLMRHIKVDDDMDPMDLAEKTSYCTGADLAYLFREAGTVALRENIDTAIIGKRHVNQVLPIICHRAKQLVDDGSLDCYEKFYNDHSV